MTAFADLPTLKTEITCWRSEPVGKALQVCCFQIQSSYYHSDHFKEQYDFATRRIEQAGLADRVEVLLCDYRDISGSYDKVVSIEMIEAVGARYLPVYFRKIQQVLKPDGVLALQAIVCPDNRFDLLKNRVTSFRNIFFREVCCLPLQLSTRLSMIPAICFIWP